MTIETDLLIIGGSDAGISAALRARELNKDIDISIILADVYPNLSICGIPYAVSKEVAEWKSLAHRTVQDLESYNINFFMNTTALSINADNYQVIAKENDSGAEVHFTYKKLLVGTGANPKHVLPSGDVDNIHVLHTMNDFFQIENDITEKNPENIAIIGAGYVGIELAEALTKRGIKVSIFQRSSEVLSTIDTELGTLVRNQLIDNGISVFTNQEIREINRTEASYTVISSNGKLFEQYDSVIMVAGVEPNVSLLSEAGAQVGVHGAIKTNDKMETSLPDIYAAGDLIVTKHRLIGDTYLPLGTTAHKQGRIAGSNMVGRKAEFQGVIGSQVLRVFDLIVARAGVLPNEAKSVGYSPISHTSVIDDHKAYIPGSTKITIKLTADKNTHKLIGAQLIGMYGSEIAKRADVYATAIYNNMTVEEISDLDLTYSPIVGAPWDAVQAAAQQLEKRL